jgi:hypothetical protein
VVLTCGVRGPVPLPQRMPDLTARMGLDRHPIELTDDDAAAWLEACVWPDQADRFHRLHHAIELARRDPPDVRRGDAVADLASSLAAMASDGHPVVTTTWVLCYLSEHQRRAFLAELDTFGRSEDLSWIAAESPSQTSGLPAPDDPSVQDLTVVTLTRWRGGQRTVTHLATAHPHGFWLHWS